MNKAFAERIRANEALIGMAISFPTPGIVEQVGGMWDWLWIDGQHGQLDYSDIVACVRMADAVGSASIVRVPSLEYGAIGRMADLAPAGIMAPMVNSAEDAKAVVNALRYPPLGQRSYGGRRIVDVAGRGYYERTNTETVLVAQIETPEAVECAEAIAATEGVDVLFVGADDLKVRLGIPIDTAFENSRALTDIMTRVADAARKAGKAVGCVAATPETLSAALALGYRLLAGGSDGAFMKAEATRRREALGKTVRAYMDGGK